MRSLPTLGWAAALIIAGPAAAQPAPDSITLLTRAGRLEEATALARAGVARAPTDPAANLRLGGLLVRVARFDSAAWYLTRVMEMEAVPWQHSWARLQLARARLGQGDTTAARGLLEQVIALEAGRNTEREAAALLSKIGGHPLLATWTIYPTDHLRVHFPPDTWVASPGDHARRLERAYRELSEFFGDLPGPADVYVWNVGPEAEAMLYRPLAFARPELLLVHMRPDQSPGHEMAHLFSFHAGRTARRSRFIDEGTSVAFNLTDVNLLREARAAARLSALPVSVAAFWDDEAPVPELLLYPIAGAFVERLIDRGGRDAFLRLLHRQTLADARVIYGPRLEGIIAEFERDLRR